MRLVLASEADHVGEWVYPGTWPGEFETPSENSVSLEGIERSAFSALWRALDSSAPSEEALLGDTLPAAGYPHYGPEGYDELNPRLLKSLLAVPTHERWRVAQSWAALLQPGSPNKERLALFKRTLNCLCDLAARRGEQMIVVLPLR